MMDKTARIKKSFELLGDVLVRIADAEKVAQSIGLIRSVGHDLEREAAETALKQEKAEDDSGTPDGD